MDVSTKSCTKCHETKPLDAFPVDTKMKSGRDSWCRKCRSKSVTQRRKVVRAERLAYEREYRTRNRPRRNEQSRQYKIAHRDRIRANLTVQRAMSNGKLQHISLCFCAQCGNSAKEYHHEDYSKPLAVIPLCKSCHRLWHATNHPKEGQLS